MLININLNQFFVRTYILFSMIFIFIDNVSDDDTNNVTRRI